MKKRVLAGLVCLALCLSLCPVAAAEEETGGYILYEMDFRINGTQSVLADGSLFSVGMTLPEPLDLTAWGYSEDEEQNTLGLQLDLFIAGEDAFVQKVIAQNNAQIEFTSSARSDKEEINCAGDAIALPFQKDTWVRHVIPLSAFAQTNRGTSDDRYCDLTGVDYFRIYKTGFTSDTNKSCIIRICKVRLVDMSREAPSVEEDPVGDGSFTAEPPVWEAAEVGEEYNRDDVVVAGYDLRKYIAEHGIQNVTDYTPIIQSLLDGLQTAGGGVLFIPEGRYPCYGEIILPIGCTVYGEWQSPDITPAVGGTVLEVYAGYDQLNGTPFITMKGNTKLHNVSFWYPVQSATAPVPYPATVKTAGYAFVENVTFVNSYQAVEQGPENAFCPNVTNIYGTPLSIGMDIDGVTDVGRFETIRFAADYWEDSALPNAPEGAESEALRSWLRAQGTAIILRRIDWSYLSHVRVIGYADGLVFRESYYAACFNESGARVTCSFPNGQCYNLYFEDCTNALLVYGVARQGETVTRFTAKNCTNGVIVSDYTANDAEGVLQLIGADITATRDAVRVSGPVQLMMTDSTVQSGAYRTVQGHHTLVNNRFLTAAPQVQLQGGTLAAVLVGNTDAAGDPVSVENEGYCPVANDNIPPETPKAEELTAEQAAKQVYRPASDTVRVASGLDATGATDVTAALQAELDALAVTGGTLYLPAGSYKLDSTVSITVPTGVQLLGSCDFGRIGYKCGTIFNVYGGRGDADGAPTFVLNEHSGMRGVMVNYPLQYQELVFEEYPFFIQGQGEGIRITNVSIRNGYNGFDLMTYRCDDHYVDYAAGICVNTFLQIGGGSVGGTVRNFQVNYNGMENGSADYMGCWEALPITIAAFSPLMRDYLRRNAVICRVGHVEDQLIFNSFNYSGYSGLQFVAEDTGAADALVFGHGVDYGSVSIDIQDAVRLQFINLQSTSFIYEGEEELEGACNIRLGEGFDGTVEVVGMLTWADTGSVFSVQGGTLSVSAFSTIHPDTPLLAEDDTGALVLNAVCLRPLHGSDIAGGAPAQITMNGGILSTAVPDAAKFAVYTNILNTVDRWDAPAGIPIGADGEMLYAEAFTGYASVKEADRLFQAEGESSAVAMRTGQVRIRLKNDSVGAGVRHRTLPLDGEGLYRLEMRLNISSLLDGAASQVLVTLGSAARTVTLAVFQSGGSFAVNGTAIGTFTCDTWYRLGVEIDTRDAAAPTARVYLMDDNYTVTATGGTFAVPAGATNLFVGAFADSDPDDSHETEVLLDYVTLSRSATSTFGGGLMGDADGNGRVDSTDARLVLQYAVKKIDAAALKVTVADVDGSATVDSTDARLILQYAVGKIVEFPTE